MKRSTVRVTLMLAFVIGCGSSDESTFKSNRCFDEDLGCGRTHCASRETCESRKCKIEEGYDDDFDYFYKSKCTETLQVTTVETPRDGNGIQTTTVRATTTECKYKEEVDEDDFEVTDECQEGDPEIEVTRETCTRDPSCGSCEPICTPLDVTRSSEPADERRESPAM